MPRIRSITTIAELSAGMMAAFNAINEHYYNGELEKPVITFKEGKKKLWNSDEDSGIMR